MCNKNNIGLYYVDCQFATNNVDQQTNILSPSADWEGRHGARDGRCCDQLGPDKLQP